MKIKFLIVALLLFVGLSAQQLNCRVTVQIDPKLNSADLGDKAVFESLRKAIFEFMNNTSFSEDTYKQYEKIDCELTITVSEYTKPSSFGAKMQIQYRRPVYNSDYASLVLNHVDEDIKFAYNENENIQYSNTAYVSELGALLSFYAHFIIGIDNETFSKNGGTTNFDVARAIMNAAQNGSGSGWKAFDGKGNNRNRYWLLENTLSPVFAPLRTCFYNYHRMGLDVMYTNEAGGRAAILKAIEELKTIHKTRPLSFNLQVFFLAKRDELVSIFKSGTPEEKQKIVEVLSTIDPTNTNRYQEITK